MVFEFQSGKTLERLVPGDRVALIRLRSLGDCVLTTPAIELLHRARPDLRIAVVVEDRFAAVFEDNPAVSAILPPDYGAILRWRPALSLNLHGGTRSQLLTAASLGRIRAGFAHHRGAWIYNVKIPRAQQILGVERVVHTAEHLASAVFFLGVPIREVPRASLFAGREAAERPYAVIHPVAAAAYKTWRPDGFLAVAEHLEGRCGLEPVFIGAGRDDLSPFSQYRVVAGASLSRLKTLLAGASLFVGNDSGPAHMACALAVPVVVLYGRPEHEVIWAPWRPVAARTLVSQEGIGRITAEETIGAIAEVSGCGPVRDRERAPGSSG
jgi:heptosyltransferase III